jgi:hypothetical protein
MSGDREVSDERVPLWLAAREEASKRGCESAYRTSYYSTGYATGRMSMMRHLVPVLAMMTCIATAIAQADPSVDAADLTATVTALDATLFDAYNRCDLELFAHYFDPGVEFYHDQGGATFDRETVVANTRKNICHKIRRQLISETLRVYPIKNYGAIEEGEHVFCQVDSGHCEGIAKFVMIWRLNGGNWVLTRILSYGHRALTGDERDALAAKAKP